MSLAALALFAALSGRRLDQFAPVDPHETEAGGGRRRRVASAAIPGRDAAGRLPPSSICARNCRAVAPASRHAYRCSISSRRRPSRWLRPRRRSSRRERRAGAGLLRARLFAQRRRGRRLADGDGARKKRRGGGRADPPRPTSGRPRSRCAGGGGAGGTPCMIGGADTVERDLAAAAAALLDQGQRADHLSRLITAASAIVLLLLPAVPGAAVGAADDNPRAGCASRSRGALSCDPCRLRCRAVPSLGGCA